MKTMNWDGIENGLRSANPGNAPDGGPDFWGEFRARAGGVKQLPPPAISPRAARWTACAACALLVGAVSWWGVVESQGSPGLSMVKSVDVRTPHSAILIVTDEAAQSTMLWIAEK